MSQTITVTSSTQTINVDAATQCVSVVQSGPQGPKGNDGGNTDGGTATSNYGGTTALDGGTA